MAFRSGRGPIKISVARFDGSGSIRLSSGEYDMAKANRMENAVEDVGPRGKQRDRELHDALTSKQLTVPEFYDAWVRRDLEPLRAKLRDEDLQPYLVEFERQRKSTLRANSLRAYMITLRQFIPPGPPFMASQFTTANAVTFLEQKPNPMTRNNDRRTLLAFASWLVVKGVLKVNPVKAIKEYPTESHIVDYSEDVCRAIIGAYDTPLMQAMAAFMCSTSAEWSACQNLKGKDIDAKHHFVQAHGTKEPGRDRPVVFTHDDGHGHDWAWDIFWRYAKSVLPEAKVFPIRHQRAWRAHKRALAAVRATLPDLEDSSLHDWRHVFAVRMRRDLEQPDWRIAALMGHTDTRMVVKIYGRFKPRREHLQVLGDIRASRQKVMQWLDPNA